MKKYMVVLTMVLFAGFAFYVSGAKAQMGSGMMERGYDSGYGGRYCPGYGEYRGPYYDDRYGMGPGMMGRGYGRGYGMEPGMMGRGYERGYGMGPGMMGRGYERGYGMGPGMMGRGYYGPQYGRQYGPQYRERQNPLDQNEARQEVEDYLASTRNPNLQVGEVQEKGDDFEVNIETKDGSLVDKVLVDKETGRMRPAY